MGTGCERLVLLSDIRGGAADRTGHYIRLLEGHFDVISYDCCELGGVPKNGTSMENRHQQFVNGGIDRAVECMLQSETEVFGILGFSIGGTIAWKACLAGLRVRYLFAVSATRLRLETEKPDAEIDLFYGERDRFRPPGSWFHLLGISENRYKNEAHEFYLKGGIAAKICRRIVQVKSQSGTMDSR